MTKKNSKNSSVTTVSSGTTQTQSLMTSGTNYETWISLVSNLPDTFTTNDLAMAANNTSSAARNALSRMVKDDLITRVRPGGSVILNTENKHYQSIYTKN